ncbi:MAG: helix-turn-helix domain-containing protein, partial [Spirochaetota bacterium]
HLQIPPLRHRKHDIPLLAAHFARQIASELGTTPPRLGSGVLRLLEAYDYPGNVRELQSIVVTLVSQGRDGRLSGERLEQLTRSTLRRNASAGLPVDPVVVFSEKLPTIEEATDQLIDEALRRSDGNQSAAARLLGVSPSAVNKRLYRRRNAGRDTV